MNQRVATTVTIGLLAAASFLVTVYLIKVPIWCLAGAGHSGHRPDQRGLPLSHIRGAPQRLGDHEVATLVPVALGTAYLGCEAGPAPLSRNTHPARHIRKDHP